MLINNNRFFYFELKPSLLFSLSNDYFTFNGNAHDGAPVYCPESVVSKYDYRRSGQRNA